MASAAEEVERLLDHLRVREPVLVCGLSMGGYVALEVWRRAPERVGAWVLASTRATADSATVREGRLGAIRRLETEGLAVFVDATVPRLLGQTTLDRQTPVVAVTREQALANRPEVLVDALRGMARRADATPWLRHVTCPTVIVVGEEDRLVTRAEAEQLCAQVSGAVLQVIPRAGHLVNVEAPDLFNDAVRAAAVGLGRIEGRSAAPPRQPGPGPRAGGPRRLSGRSAHEG